MYDLKEERIDEGKVILREGTSLQKVYFMVDGELSINIDRDDGAEVQVEILK